MFKFNKNNQDEKNIDIKKVNEIISITNIILKIVFVLGILLILYLFTNVSKSWGIDKFLITLLDILMPLFIGIIFAWLFNPLITYLNKKGINRIIGSIIVFVLFIGIIYLVIYSFIPIMVDEVNDFSKILPSLLENIEVWIDNIFDKLGGNEFDFTTTKLDLYKSINTYTTTFVTELPVKLIGLVKGTFSFIIDFIVGLIIGLYLLFNFNSSSNRLGRLMPSRVKIGANALFKKIDYTMRSFTQGILITSTIIFLVCSAGFAIAGLKAPLFFGLFCALTNIIPYVGPYIGAFPAIIVGFVQGPVTGITVSCIILIIQTIEGNFIQPLVMSRMMKLHPVTIIVGLLIFGYFFGIWGMILATPIISITKIIATTINEKYKIIKLEE